MQVLTQDGRNYRLNFRLHRMLYKSRNKIIEFNQIIGKNCREKLL